MQAAAASSPKDVEGDESLRSFVDDLDHVLGAQWPSASPAARAEDWLPTLTRAVSVNRTVRSLKEEKEAVVPPVPPVVLFSARQPLGYHGRLLPLQHSGRAAHLDASGPSPADLVEISGTEGAIDARHQLQSPIAADGRHAPVLANDEPYSRQNLALFQVFCERVLSLSPLIQLASPHPDLDPLFCDQSAASANAASAYLLPASQHSILDSKPVGADASVAVTGPASIAYAPSTSCSLAGFRSAHDVPTAVSTVRTPLSDLVRTEPASSVPRLDAYAVANADETSKSSGLVQWSSPAASSNRPIARGAPQHPHSEVEKLLRLAGITTVPQLQLLVSNSAWLDKLVAEMVVAFPDHLRSFGDRFYLKQAISRVLRMSDAQWT